MTRSQGPRLLPTCCACLALLRSPAVDSFLHVGIHPQGWPERQRHVGAATTRARTTCSGSPPGIILSTRRGGGAATETDTSGMRDLESLQIGERLKGIVVDELDGATGKKAWVRLGVTRRAKGGTRAYVDGMLRLNKEKGLKPRKVAIDRPVTVYVKEVIAAEGRLEVSLRAPKIKATREQLAALRPLAELEIGQELQGTVITVTQFAAFVSCGVGRPSRRIGPDGKAALMEEEHGFLAKEDLPEDAALSEQLVKSQDIRRIIGKGDRVRVFVKDVLPGNGRFRLTMDETITPEKVKMLKRRTERQKAKYARRREAADLEVGEEILGEVVKAFDYGFFVDVGAKDHGLVHITSISKVEDRYIQSLADFATVGDAMYVRVNGIDDQGRLSLDFVARERDRPRRPNRRERRMMARGEQGGDAGADSRASASASRSSDSNDVDDGGFFWDSSPGGSRSSGLDDDDDDGYKSNLNYDDFDL